MRSGIGVLILVLAAGGLACNRSQSAADSLTDPFVAMRLRENSRARVLLDSAAATRPAVQAYGLATLDGVADGNDLAGARRRLKALAADAGDPVAPWAALTLVRMDHVPANTQTPVDYAALGIAYAGVVRDYPATPAADEAFVYQMALTLVGKSDDELADGIRGIDAYLTARPRMFYQSAVLMVRSRMQTRLKRYNDALASAIASFDSRQQDPTGLAANVASDLFTIGVMAQFDVGDFKTARQFYGKLIERYPTDQRLFLVNQFMQEMAAVEAGVEADVRAKGGPS